MDKRPIANYYFRLEKKYKYDVDIDKKSCALCNLFTNTLILLNSTMVFKCVIKCCSNKLGDKPMHVFPKDPNVSSIVLLSFLTLYLYISFCLQLFKLWTEALKRDDIKIEKRKNFRICDVHFPDSMKFRNYHNRTNLQVGAIPTLLLSGEYIFLLS